MAANINSLVSVITPVYQAEAFLAQTIESVLAQTYGDWELLLVIDQKSSDRSGQIAAEFAKREPRIRVLEEFGCLGVAANRNLGLDRAGGDYIAFLDADDLWKPQKLEQQLRFMLDHGIEFSFHDYGCVNARGVDMRRPVRSDKAQITYTDLLAHNYIGCLTVMLTRTRLDSLRFYQGHHEDFCLWLDLTRDGKPAVHFRKELAYYRVLSGSRSGNKFLAAQARWQILREREKLSFRTSAFFLLHYVLYGVLKRL